MTDERAAEGVEHLQAAGRELLAAARVFLDVVEDLVEDRSRLADAAAVVSEVVRDGLGRRGAPFTAAWADAADADHGDAADHADADPGAGDTATGPGADPGANAPAAAGTDPAGQDPSADEAATDPAAGPGSSSSRPTRVRRIPVD